MTRYYTQVWSIGCTVFQMATGEPPWKSELGTQPFYYRVGMIKPDDPLPLKMPEYMASDIAVHPPIHYDFLLIFFFDSSFSASSTILGGAEHLSLLLSIRQHAAVFFLSLFV